LAVPADLSSFEALFHRHYGSLCEFVCAYVAAPDVAEELVQDVFVKIWDRQNSPSPPDVSVHYLYAAARNRAIGHLRRERVARRFSEAATTDEAPEHDVSDELQARDVSAAVEAAVAALPDRCRLVFTMSRYEGLTYSEIAEALDISRNTVETQMSRALKALRARLAPLLGLALTILSR
jgi:RNA polymerase sigma-70 factor, ECF subfamily